MIPRMMTLVLALTAGVASGGTDRSVIEAFERLKTLVGTWRIAGGDSEVIFSLTGEGSAVIERFEGMSSVYHMDGNDLRVTHYCGARNQPRMKAIGYDAEKGLLRFDFVDVTNVAAPDAYFTREIEILFIDEDNAEIWFNGLDKGEERPSTVRLRRK